MKKIASEKYRKNTLKYAAGFVSLQVVAAMPIAADDESEGFTIDEIVILGEKQSKSLADTNSSVGLITASDLENSNITDLYEAFQRVANVSLTDGNQGFSIRGIDFMNITNSDSAVNSTTLASVYLDGAVMPTPAVAFGGYNTWDIAQIEIFRGPQSTTQGRNTLAGAINIRSRDPEFEWGGRAQARIAEHGTRQISATLNAPIVYDELALRLSADTKKSDGFITNPTLSDNEFGRSRSTFLRGKLLWQPEHIEGLTVRLTGIHSNSYQGTVEVAPDTPFDFENVSNHGIYNDVESTIFTLETSYDLSETTTLTSVTSYSDTTWVTADDEDGTATDFGDGFDGGFGIGGGTDEQFTQELRLNYQSDRLSAVIGGYYASLDNADFYPARIFTNTAASLPGPDEMQFLLESALGTPLPPGTGAFVSGTLSATLPTPTEVTSNFNNTRKIENLALFGQADYDISDHITLTVGGRLDYEKQNTMNASDITIITPWPTYGDPLLDGVLALLRDSVETGFAENGRGSFTVFLPKAGLTYNWTDDISTSFTFQRGYRSGGVMVNQARALNGLPDAIVSYDPEYTSNYEVAFRSNWLDGRLYIGANAYLIDWTDQQVAVQQSDQLRDENVENAGSSRLKGFEIEVNAHPTEDISLFASVGHSDTEFLTFETIGGFDFAGNRFPYSPKWNMAFGLSYAPVEGLFAQADINYQSDSFSGAANRTDSLNDSRTIANARVGYRFDNWSLYAYANNLFDEKYLTSNRRGAFMDIPGEPRAVGVGFLAEF